MRLSAWATLNYAHESVTYTHVNIELNSPNKHLLLQSEKRTVLCQKLTRVNRCNIWQKKTQLDGAAISKRFNVVDIFYHIRQVAARVAILVLEVHLGSKFWEKGRQ